MRNENLTRAAALLLSLVVALPAAAHTGQGVGGLAQGFAHPFAGIDHITVMVAVGFWAAILGGFSVWLVPVAFLLAMALGCGLGLVGSPFPGIEAGIALSALVLGLLLVFRVRPSPAIAASLVGFFAVFHGYAHGAELPEAANPLAFSLGFVAATAILHVGGMALGMVAKSPKIERLVPIAGGALALSGVAFLSGML